MKCTRTIFEIEGSGSDQVLYELVNGNSRISREVVGHLFRQPVGGTATAVDIYLICGDKPFDSDDPSVDSWNGDAATIPEEYIVFKVAAATPTADAIVPFITGPVGSADRHPVSTGRCYLVVVPTAAGAWSLTGYVEFRG